MNSPNAPQIRNDDRDALIDLAAGELRGLAAWRLCRRIARDPSLAAEWEETQRLRTSLTRYVQKYPDAAPRPALHNPHRISRRRAAFALAGAFLLAIIGGFAAVATRLNQPSIIAYGFSEAGGPQWSVSGDFKGKVTVYNPQGKILAKVRNPAGDPVHGVVHVEVATVRTELRKRGRYEIRDKTGKLLGVLVFIALHEEDRVELSAERKIRLAAMAQSYERSPRFPVTAGSGNGGGYGVFTTYDARHGVSLKFLGYGAIRYVYPAIRKKAGVPQEGGSSDSGYMPLPDGDPSDPFYRLMTTHVPKPDVIPEIFWARARKDASGVYAVKDAWWRDVAASGHFIGYGKHFIKDERGNTILTIELAPPGTIFRETL